MDKPTCGTCLFWEPHEWFVKIHGKDCKEGFCHGDTPKADEMQSWPAVPSKGFCRHHHAMPAYVAWLGDKPVRDV